MKPSGIGGQAVIEGVMMKNGSKCAVAVRKPNNEIVVEKSTILERKNKFLIYETQVTERESRSRFMISERESHPR